jgi:Xaa-Pro aminopeptidase
MDDTHIGPGLPAALAAAGCELSAAQVDDIIDGVLAAPEGLDASAWTVLVADPAPPALKDALAARMEERRAAAAANRYPSASERLAALRAELGRVGIDAFLIPRADEHQGEYVSARADRLAWLTGFTGSAGMAAVAKTKAAVFVDGRYTLQVEAEVDGTLYQRRHLTEAPVTDWIAETLKAGDKLGYDPWLATPHQVARFKDACAKAGAELVALDTNPLDAVWDGQPPPPLAPVLPLDEAYSGESSAAKRQRMAELIAAEGADAVVLTQPDSIAWLFNIRGADVPFTPFALSFAVLKADATAKWFVDARKLTPAARAALNNAVEVLAPDALGTALDELGRDGLTVRADPATAASWIHERLAKAGAKLQRKDDPCQLAKARKNAVQQAGMRTAHHRDGAAVAKFLAWLAEAAAGGGVGEIAAADKLEGFRREHDLFRGLSFPTISGAGPNGAIVHYRVTPETERALEPGSLYLVDSGAQYPDGTTDITRTVAIGTPSADMRRHFTLVLKGHIALARAVFPKGTSGSQLDVLARSALWRAGLDYDHGTGHGVGSYLSVHEGPQRVSKMPNSVALEPGMVVSNEPGFYLSGRYGIRIENLVQVTKAEGAAGDAGFLAFETITLAPIDRNLIETALLDAEESAWLDAYHARVRDSLAPQLTGSAAAWLAAATAPVSGGGTS